MDETSILIIIGFACAILAVVSAYLIYQYVQEERLQVNKAKIRREKDQLGPSEFLKDPSTTRKLPLKGPVIVPAEPDPTLEPIVTDELPVDPEPDPEPVQQPEPPAESISPFVSPPPVAIAGGAVAGATVAAAAAEAKKTKNVEEKPPKQKKEKTSKTEQPRRGSTKYEDFDDYRNFSPVALPAPKNAPPPPAAIYEPPKTPVHMEHHSPETFQMLDRQTKEQIDRDGLLF